MEEKYFIGVDIGASKIRAGIENNGKLLDVQTFHINNSDNSSLIIEGVIRSIKSIIKPSTKSIGIGVPSVVDTDKGVVYDVVNIPSWNEIHLRNILEEKFNIPVYVDNDVNCFTIGERYYGEGIGYKDIVGITIGSGIGSGIISGGKLNRGFNCGAGEIGMLPYKDSILEHYASSQFLKESIILKGAKFINLLKKVINKL